MYARKQPLLLCVFCVVLHRVLAGLGIDDFLHIMWSTNAVTADSSLQLSISAQAVGTAIPSMLPHPSPPANLGKMAIRAMLWPLGLFVLYSRRLCTLCLHHEWKDGKRSTLSKVETTKYLRLPKYWPLNPLSTQRVCPAPAPKANILEDARHWIGLLQYNPSTEETSAKKTPFWNALQRYEVECNWVAFICHDAVFPWTYLVWCICKINLKRQCHEIFEFWFFSWISFPQALEYSITTVANIFKNSRRYSQLKVHHWCRWLWWQMEKIFNQKNLTVGFFLIFCSSMYCIQHCFNCRPSDSSVSEDAGIEPRTVATSALATRRSNH